MAIYQKRSSLSIFRGIRYIILIAAALYVLFPLYFLVISALKTDSEIFLHPFSLPIEWQFQNFKEVLIDQGFYRYILNSVYYAVVSVVLTLVVSVTASYAISRMRWKQSKHVNMLLMAGIMIPIHAVILPLYLTVRSMGMQNPRVVLVCIFSAFALPKSIFILSGFLKDISFSIEEAAVIDGANIFTILLRVIAPLLKPAIATVCIFDFLTVWNDLLIGLIFINRDQDRTLQLGIMRFIGDYVTMYNYVFAAVLIAIIPSILVFIFFQKQIVEGITAGAVKG